MQINKNVEKYLYMWIKILLPGSKWAKLSPVSHFPQIGTRLRKHSGLRLQAGLIMWLLQGLDRSQIKC